MLKRLPFPSHPFKTGVFKYTILTFSLLSFFFFILADSVPWLLWSTQGNLVNVTIVLQTGSDCIINTIQKWAAINLGTATDRKAGQNDTRCRGIYFAVQERKPTWTPNTPHPNKPCPLQTINRICLKQHTYISYGRVVKWDISLF